jgi:IS30 family transposase
VGHLTFEGLKKISHETIYQRICVAKRNVRNAMGWANHTLALFPIEWILSNVLQLLIAGNEHWEGDTIIGAHNGGAVIASMVESKSRLTCLTKAKDKTTLSVISSINKHMLPIADWVLTVTLDNG